MTTLMETNVRLFASAKSWIEGEALRPYTVVRIAEVKESDYAVGGKTLTAADVHGLQQAKAA